MENYVIIDVMCPGCFGVTLLVKDRESGLEQTLKKVDCLDVIAADKAFQEALCLLNLSHPNIVSYKEFFTSWNKHISSVTLSMVMDCPCMKTLRTVIASQREQKQKFENEVMQMFLGQMLDALAYLHSRNILHRNLKPSNILVTSDDRGSAFRMCDFGTATVMGDRARLQIRVKNSAKSWMAPESVGLLQWSDKSDIWTFGCVLLDMLTCHILDEEAFLSLVQNRENLSLLDFGISRDFHQLLNMMFIYNPKRRASVWLLVKEELVKQSLILCGFSLHMLKKTLPEGLTEPPFHEGFDSVLEFMMTYTHVEAAQLSVLSYLLEEEENALCRVSDVVKAVTFAMLCHMGSVCVQLKSCYVLQLLIAGTYTGKENSWLCGESVISCVLEAVRNFLEHCDLLSCAFQTLVLISPSGEACDLILKLGGVQHALNALKAYPEEEVLVIPCCKCLWSTLAQGCGTPESMASAVETVCMIGPMHMQSADVTEALCAALQSLTMHGKCCNPTALCEDKMTENAMDFLMHALREQPHHCGIVNHAFVAMANLISSSEMMVVQVLRSSEGSGVPLIMSARRLHPNDPKVTANLCNLLKQLLQHDNLVPELLAENVQEELEQIVEQFESTMEIVLLAQEILSKVMSLNDAEQTIST
ncbi:serine/threonine kinase-like domain-containing protein STKLD1 isoform X2 [Brachyhypopomus gauderio]|uniref:serine/threonine kinase-like domain-containing protein STKLD1 isoform X2 n=1 Tax=Brachyhypopomus gauderio TaxID=698409 RepID=UPI00404139DB